MNIQRQSIKFFALRQIFSLFFCFQPCLINVLAQETRTQDLQNFLDEKKQVAMPLVQPAGVALESTVNPENYFVGPSDVIAVNIWMSPALNFTLTVTPEGTLIIPTAGEVPVAGLTLKEAKAKIIQTVRKKYLSAEITATLVKPRPIIVTILGNVLNPGLYTATASDRANKVIEDANVPRLVADEQMVAAINKDMSKRNIALKHNDGSIDRVDIVRFQGTKDDRWNPYLREGDVITVPKRDNVKNVIGIYGQVNAPGRYEFVEGDSLLNVLSVAQGFTRTANTDTIEFSRLSADGASISTKEIDLKAIRLGSAVDFPLQPGDRIVVKAHIDLREDYRVEVTGEVLYPGVYPISKNRTRLSDIINHAGGFTQDASLVNAEIIRQSVSPEKIDFERLMTTRGAISSEDSVDFRVETELRLKKEFVTVDFVKLFVQHDSSQDVILQSDDIINISKRHQTVYVFGQVVLPGHIAFAVGKDYEYYIDKAGGFTDRARKGDIRVIKARTQQWLEPGKTSIEEGDYLWIPKEPDRPFAYYMTIASQMASVLSVVIGIGVVIVQLTK